MSLLAKVIRASLDMTKYMTQYTNQFVPSVATVQPPHCVENTLLAARPSISSVECGDSVRLLVLKLPCCRR